MEHGAKTDGYGEYPGSKLERILLSQLGRSRLPRLLPGTGRSHPANSPEKHGRKRFPFGHSREPHPADSTIAPGRGFNTIPITSKKLG